MELLKRCDIKLSNVEISVLYIVFLLMSLLCVVATVNNTDCLLFLLLTLLFCPPIANCIISLCYKLYIVYIIIKTKSEFNGLTYEERYNIEQGFKDLVNGKETDYVSKTIEFVNKISK